MYKAEASRVYLIAALVMTLIEAYRLVQVFGVARRVNAHLACRLSDLCTKGYHNVVFFFIDIGFFVNFFFFKIDKLAFSLYHTHTHTRSFCFSL